GTLRVTGRKTLVVAGMHADSLLVSAFEAGAVSLLLLPAAMPGITQHAYRLIDGTPACDVIFDAAAIASSMRIGPPGSAASAIESAQQHAGIARYAQALRVMDRAIDVTRDYLLQRRQFGAPIA